MFGDSRSETSSCDVCCKEMCWNANMYGVWGAVDRQWRCAERHFAEIFILENIGKLKRVCCLFCVFDKFFLFDPISYFHIVLFVVPKSDLFLCVCVCVCVLSVRHMFESSVFFSD